MPYKKDTTDPLTRTLKGYFTTAELAELLNLSRTTAISRLKDPNTLTVGEIRRINTHGHVPIEKLREVI